MGFDFGLSDLIINVFWDSSSLCAIRKDLITVYDIVSVNLTRDCLMHAVCRSNESNTFNIRYSSEKLALRFKFIFCTCAMLKVQAVCSQICVHVLSIYSGQCSVLESSD